MKDPGILPLSKHSQKGPVISSYDDDLAVLARCCHFDMDNATGSTTIQNIMYKAITVGVTAKQLKEITTNEETALKNYLTAYPTYMQNIRSQGLLRKYAPQACMLIADGAGKDLFSTDEWVNEIFYSEAEKHLSIPKLDEFIIELNPVFNIEDPFDLLDYPGCVYLLWTPKRTITELETDRQTLIVNSFLARSALDKLGIAHGICNPAAFVDIPAPVIKPWDWEDYRYRFWATHAWVTYWDGAAEEKHFPSDGSGAKPDITTATWMNIIPYVLDPSNPRDNHLFHGLFRLLYPYQATGNPIGCAEADNTSNQFGDTSKTISTDDAEIGKVAKQDISGGNADEFDFCTAAETLALFGTAPIVFGYNSTYPISKNIETPAGTTFNLLMKALMGNKRYLLYSSNRWGSNYNPEFQVWRNIFRGVSGKDKQAGTPRGNTKPKSNPYKNKKED
jgi:hypothetical protein